MTPLPGRWLPLTSDDTVRLHPRRPWLSVASVSHGARTATLRRLDLDTDEWLPLANAQHVTFLNHHWAGDGVAYALLGHGPNGTERPLVGLLDGEGNGPLRALRLSMQIGHSPAWLPFDGDPFDGHARPDADHNRRIRLDNPYCHFTPLPEGTAGHFTFYTRTVFHASLRINHRADTPSLVVTQVIQNNLAIYLHPEGNGFARLLNPEHQPGWRIELTNRERATHTLALPGVGEWVVDFPLVQWTDPDTLLLIARRPEGKRRSVVWRLRTSTGELTRLDALLGETFAVIASTLSYDRAQLALLLADDDRRSQRVVVLDLGTDTAQTLALLPHDSARSYDLAWLTPTAFARLDQAAFQKPGAPPSMHTFDLRADDGAMRSYALPAWPYPITLDSAACGRALLSVPEEAGSRRLRWFLTEPLVALGERRP